MIKKSVALLTLALFVGAHGAALAGEGQTKAEGEKEQDMHGEYQGTLVCLGCSLKGDGARSACKEYGHTHALKTGDDEYILFLVNQYSADLMAGEKFHNKEVAVHGVYFANANQLDVETYEVDGKKYGWCDHCSAMDGCAFSMKE